MAAGWRHDAKVAGVTALVVSCGWLAVVAAVWNRAPAPAPTARQALLESATTAPRAFTGRLLLPVAGVRPDQLTDTFTQARAGGARVHDAIDIMAPRGTPVLAAAPGTVEKLFLSKDGGNTIYERSEDRRTIYYYAHLDAYAPGLAEGARIAQGQQIGTVGFTGNANPAGPHLHFALWPVDPQGHWWDKGIAQNPYPLLAHPH